MSEERPVPKRTQFGHTSSARRSPYEYATGQVDRSQAGFGSDPSSAKPGANPVPRGGRSAGGGGPVGGDPLLRLGQRHRPGADPPVQLVLDLVLRVRRRARLRPEVPLVAGSAAELQRDQMVFLVTPWAGVGVAVGGNLLALQRIGVGRGRPDGGRVARPADRRADSRLDDRRVGRAGGAGSVGQHATGDGPGWLPAVYRQGGLEQDEPHQIL